jgi:hypothetical protein
MDPADCLTAAAQDSSYAEPYRPLEFSQGAAHFAEHDTGADDDQSFAESGDRGNGGFPAAAGLAEKVIGGGIGLFERAGIGDRRIGAVPADSGAADNGLHFIGDVTERFDEEVAAFGPAFFNDFFSFGAPSFVGYAGAGKMDDIIGLADGFGVDERRLPGPSAGVEGLAPTEASAPKGGKPGWLRREGAGHCGTG